MLLDAWLRAAPNLLWEEQLELTAEGWTPTESRLRIANGLAYTGNVDVPVADLVASCRNGRRLRDLLANISLATGQEADSLTTGFLRVVRRLVALGCLLPVETPSTG